PRPTPAAGGGPALGLAGLARLVGCGAPREFAEALARALGSARRELGEGALIRGVVPRRALLVRREVRRVGLIRLLEAAVLQVEARGEVLRALSVRALFVLRGDVEVRLDRLLVAIGAREGAGRVEQIF